VSSDSTDLKKVMAEKIPAFQEEVKKFRKDHGNKVIGEITVDQVIETRKGPKTKVNKTRHLVSALWWYERNEGTRLRNQRLRSRRGTA